MFSSIVVNYWAVGAAAVAQMVFGALWYSPMLFGKVWARTSGISMEKMKGSSMMYVVAFIWSLVSACVLAHFVSLVGVGSAMEGMQLGFWLWLGFIAPVTAGMVLWEGKSKKLWILTNAYHLLALMLMGAILAVWA